MSALVVLSYGGKGTVMCEDGGMVELQEIVDMFSKKNCPAQDGNPKLVLIQACGAKLKGVGKYFTLLQNSCHFQIQGKQSFFVTIKSFIFV